MCKKFILVLEEAVALPPDMGNKPGFYFVREGSSSFLKFIPEDIRMRPSCMEIDSEQLDKHVMKGFREGELLRDYDYIDPELKEKLDSKLKEQPLKTKAPQCEWVSSETLIKVVELLAKK